MEASSACSPLVCDQYCQWAFRRPRRNAPASNSEVFGRATTQAWMEPGLRELMCRSAMPHGPRQCKHKYVYAGMYKIHKNKNSTSQTLHMLMYNQRGSKRTGLRGCPQCLIGSNYVFYYCPNLPSVPLPPHPSLRHPQMFI